MFGNNVARRRIIHFINSNNFLLSSLLYFLENVIVSPVLLVIVTFFEFLTFIKSITIVQMAIIAEINPMAADIVNAVISMFRTFDY